MQGHDGNDVEHAHPRVLRLRALHAHRSVFVRSPDARCADFRFHSRGTGARHLRHGSRDPDGPAVRDTVRSGSDAREEAVRMLHARKFRVRKFRARMPRAGKFRRRKRTGGAYARKTIALTIKRSHIKPIDLRPRRRPRHSASGAGAAGHHHLFSKEEK